MPSAMQGETSLRVRLRVNFGDILYCESKSDSKVVHVWVKCTFYGLTLTCEVRKKKSLKIFYHRAVNLGEAERRMAQASLTTATKWHTFPTTPNSHEITTCPNNTVMNLHTNPFSLHLTCIYGTTKYVITKLETPMTL